MATSLPSMNPRGHKLSADQIQLHRTVPRDYKVVDLLVNAFEFVKQHPAETIVSQVILFFVFMVFYVISYVAFIVFALVGSGLSAVLIEVNEILAQVVMVGIFGVAYLVYMAAMIAIQATLIGAYNVIIFRVVRGQNPSLEQMKDVVPFIKPLVFTLLLMNMAVLGGSLLLIIPGYIFLLGFFLAQYIVLDKNLGPVEALKASWRLTSGHKLNLFGFLLLSGLLNIAGMLACGVGMFVTIPMTLIGVVSMYDALAEPGNAYAPEANASDVFS